MSRVQGPAYEIRDHTADILLRAWGASWPDLFCNALAGLYGALGSIVTTDHCHPVTVSLAAEDGEGLFHDWLSEALYYVEARHQVLEVARFAQLNETRLRADAVAHAIDMERSAFDREVKAVTYHELAIRREDDRWVATVVLDI